MDASNYNDQINVPENSRVSYNVSETNRIEKGKYYAAKEAINYLIDSCANFQKFHSQKLANFLKAFRAPYERFAPPLSDQQYLDACENLYGAVREHPGMTSQPWYRTVKDCIPKQIWLRSGHFENIKSLEPPDDPYQSIHCDPEFIKALSSTFADEMTREKHLFTKFLEKCWNEAITIKVGGFANNYQKLASALELIKKSLIGYGLPSPSGLYPDRYEIYPQEMARRYDLSGNTMKIVELLMKTQGDQEHSSANLNELRRFIKEEYQRYTQILSNEVIITNNKLRYNRIQSNEQNPETSFQKDVYESDDFLNELYWVFAKKIINAEPSYLEATGYQCLIRINQQVEEDYKNSRKSFSSYDTSSQHITMAFRAHPPYETLKQAVENLVGLRKKDKNERQIMSIYEDFKQVYADYVKVNK